LTVPNALPKTVPAGRYICRVVNDPVEKASSFPGQEGRTYLQLDLRIQNEDHEWFDYPLSTSIKSPSYHAILRVCGGKVLMNGMTQAPPTLVGCRFIAKIGERLSQDKKRQVNEILDVWPCQGPEPLPKEAPAEAKEEILDDDGEPAPF
jgi:hypothetical protein